MGSSANYVAQVEGGLPISEKKLARYADALGRSVPWLRYGVADAIDVAAIERDARAAARAELLADLGLWAAHAAAPSTEPPLTPQEVAGFVNEELAHTRARDAAPATAPGGARKAVGGGRGRGRRR